MNPDTGHLIDARGMDERQMREQLGEGYMPVPPGHLSRRAQKLLAGEASVTVKLSDPLTKAMKRAKKRQQRAQKAARKRSRTR